MTEFNFTVRATDDIGAYSERDFSIKVNNTQVNQFVATTVAGDIMTSIDGITWARQFGVLSGISYVTGDVINGNGFWLIAESRTTYLHSVDALTWTRYNWPSGFVWNITNTNSISAGENRQFSYGNGKIAVILLDSSKTTTYEPSFFSTEDGINWVQGGSITGNLSSPHYSGAYIGNLAYGNGVWLANYNKTNAAPLNNNFGSTINNNVFLFKSIDDGATWTPVNNPQGLGTNVGSANINFINGLWIVVTGSTNYYISTDTLIWQTIASPHEKSLYFHIGTMTYNNGRLIAWPEAYSGGAGATVGSWSFWYTSLDGINWTKSENTYDLLQTSTTSTNSNYFSLGYAANATYLQKISLVTSNGVTVLGSNINVSAGSLGLGYSTDFGNTFTSANVTNNGTTTAALISGLAALRQVDI